METREAVEGHEAVRDSVVGMALKAAAVVALAVTAVQSVVVPRGLYADGAYNLWLVLHERDFVVIGPARTFAILLNQVPVVSALTLGVRDLDVLTGVYSFGVAAVPVLLWALALILQRRGPFFWPLATLYAVAFLNAGFIAIGEYTYAFALVAVVVAVLARPAAVGGAPAVVLVVASTALVLAYEGMVFLGIPVLGFALVRLLRPAWIGASLRGRHERKVLLYVVGALTASVAVGALSIGIRALNAADTNLAGAMNVGFALQSNRQWQVSAGVGLVLLLAPLVRPPWVRTLLVLAAGAGAVLTFRSDLWSPAWLHYNTRSLATYTFCVLLTVALAALLVGRRRADSQGRGPARVPVAVADVSGFAAVILVAGMTTAFLAMTAGYGRWLDELAQEVRAGEGPIPISETELYSAEGSQYSWGWTNPYLSALLQTRDGQGSVLSHVDTLDTFLPIAPPSTPEFFEEYHR